jgi:2-oxo-4-hydroxy-4-carboxy-5-ureidoimidazoline decarboxylase
MMSLAAANAMSPDEFAAVFGDVAEHSPWVARAAAGRRPFATRQSMIDAFAEAVRNADRNAALALIRAHPDLAGRAELTDDSSREQAGAGLSHLTPEEFARFSELNDRYRAKFGFPFILAVKGAAKEQILSSFADRLMHSAEEELGAAIDQICRIFRFRIEERVAP